MAYGNLIDTVVETKKTKILYVITKSNYGGAQRYVFDLATSLPEDQFEVQVALGGTGEKDAATGTLESTLKARGVRTIFVRSFMRDISFFRELSVFRELLSIIKGYDVVHLNSSKAGGIGALAARFNGIKNIIFTSHGLAYDEDRGMLARIAIWFATWATCLLCHKVIVLSQDNFKRARQLPFCSRKITLIHNGIKPVEFRDREIVRSNWTQRFNLSVTNNTIWLGTIAELTKNKGLSYTLQSLSELQETHPDFVYMLIGDGEERRQLESLVEKYNLGKKVKIIGFLANASDVLPAFDIFTLSSVKEGLPYVLLEAGLAGCAVVASRVGGIPDVIEHEVTGLLANPKNPEEIKKNLIRYEDSALRTRMGDSLKTKLAKEFSFEKMVEKTVSVYGR